jgi:hypothetical protein
MLLIKYMDVLENYFNEIREDIKFDQINILEKQLALPAIKHKWVSYLIKAKLRKHKLEKKKKELGDELFKNLSENNEIPSGMPKTSIQLKIKNSKTIKLIDEEITELNIVIDYLEKVEKIFSSVTYDIGNAAKLMVLETT